MSDSIESVAVLYGRWRQGDRFAGDSLYSSAFRRLRTIAASLLSREQFQRTLQPTSLVSELFLKFYHSAPEIADDEHFFHLSACAMRQVLTDYSRSRTALKRVPPFVIAGLLQSRPVGDHDQFLAVQLVFQKLHRLDPLAAEVIRSRCVEGFTISETAARLAIRPWQVRANYDFGLKWMAGELSSTFRQKARNR